MFSRDRWDEIIEALTANWFRTLLTAFGVLWGIFILVILLAAGKGLENGVKQGFSGMATNSMFMWSQTISKSYKGLPKGRNYNFKLADVEAIKETVPGLEIVSPRNQLGGFGGANNVVRGLNSGAYNVYGDYPEIIRQQPMDITSGRFINYSDIEQKRKVAIIGEGVKAGLYDINEEVLGTYIKINGVNFMVVGTYKKKGSGGNVEEQQKEIFVPFTAYSQAFNMGDVVGWMAITADDDHSITELKSSVFDVIKTRHSIHPEDDRAVGNFDLYEEYSRINGLFIALRLVAYFVGTLVLLSGIIGISNIMLIVVKERTNEIGVRRALGASPWSIRGQILLESIFLTIVSGMAGIILSTLVIYVVNSLLDGMDTSEMMFLNPTVNIGVVLIALAILVISGLLAGLIPAQNAIKIKPVDALRTE
ncbi:putative ABC transport system permease protein [Zunongwangia mangrovi]|uniref:Putative ABC transport system permease protein n=1 Tax=Zunongwangia mangrovi TaxID=1334022 RepID=A0A1I1D2P3_9FLAO|nr:ABC transporter permease [Zunongwangia mangrovi]SFB69074.1 putative ABC transport system permease protein [Zunongwangia mangrovi]